ncbi:MAG: TIGR01777 family oxidoreductase [Candidatus Acidiferrum sp.]|jgi:uncharacterized protein (TIGR01777 family)
MKVLITGATGLVGTALVEFLPGDGHEICRLLRKRVVDEPEAKQGCDLEWDPRSGDFGRAAEDADAVVNLAGASIADGRWTDDRKKLLRDSRVETTRGLVAAMEKMSPRPRVLVSASAVGYYGSRGSELLTEDSGSRGDFLGRLAEEWEAEAVKAQALGVRVVRLRFGIILAKRGGALRQMMLPFRVGAGGKLGPGTQWMSWVALADVVRVVRFVLENQAVSGAINVVSPQPVTNAEFTKVLARAMHRPAFLTVPSFALRALFGEMADALLASERVVPRALQESGYQFLYTDLGAALTAILRSE